jgi:hypothetical protein
MRFKSSLCLIVSVAIISLISGCTSSPTPTQTRRNAPTAANAARTPEAVIYADDAMLRRPYAVLGGTVENISGSRLEEVSVELELQKRSDGSKERRSVKVNPKDLGPGERGTYSLKILSEEWEDSRIVSLQTQAGKNEIAFRTAQGARRPPEVLPEKVTVTQTVNGPQPKKRSGDDEFINSPDKPIAVP